MISCRECRANSEGEMNEGVCCLLEMDGERQCD